MTRATIRCLRCLQDAPPGVPGGFLCAPCEEALGGVRTRRGRGTRRAVEGPPAPSAPSQRPDGPGGRSPSPTGDLAGEARALRLEVEELRREAEALRQENALLTRGANLLLGSVAEDLPPARAGAVLAWEREWRLLRARREGMPGPGE